MFQGSVSPLTQCLLYLENVCTASPGNLSEGVYLLADNHKTLKGGNPQLAGTRSHTSMEATDHFRRPQIIA